MQQKAMRSLAALAFLLPLMLMGCLQDSSSPSPEPGGDPPGRDCPDTIHQQVTDLINQERTAEGLPALAVDIRLAAAAQGHTADMALNEFMSHTGSDDSSPFDRMIAAGYYYSTAGENVAAGYGSAEAVVAAWMNSPGHYANIMRDGFAQIGVGYALSSSHYAYWCTTFGTATDVGQSLPNGCHP